MGDSHIHEEGKFFGCYLLCSKSERYKGITYIGFTVNPNRRIQQHNAGYNKGGAKRTSGKGPWDMVLIIHGFPNEISALRFEWAWQNPEKSLRLKHLVPKTKQYNFQFKFSIVCEMLRIGPWCRLPLTIRWLKQEYKRDFPLSKLPPTHMPIVYGLVELVKKKKSKNQNQEIQQIFDPNDKCYICKIEINQDEVLIKNLNGLKCLSCSCITHTTCLANLFIEQNSFKDGLQLLPIEGDCPKCRVHLMWGDLTKFRLGNFKLNNWDANADEADDDNEDEEDEEEDFVERDVESD